MNQLFGTAYYIAPEIVNSEKYDEKCDLWSIGVIMYILLTGCPPFDGKTDNDIMKSVKAGKYPTGTNEYKWLSNDAKDLIKQLLTYKPSQRISAQSALTHSWITKNKVKDTSTVAIEASLDNLRNFRTQKKMQQVALTFMVSFLSSSNEIKEFKQAFNKLDLNRDGKISWDELKKGYIQIYGDMADEMVEEIFAKVDTNNDGAIEYTEFLAASIDKESLLSEEKLQAAFKNFDKDGSGTISASEIKDVLGVGKNIPERIWDEIIGEVDDDGSKAIDYIEFKWMMMELIDNEIKSK